MNKLIITQDKRKLATITCSYVLIAVCIGTLAYSQHVQVPLMIVCIGLIAALFIAVGSNIRTMTKDITLFTFNEHGVTDKSKPSDVISIPWDQVLQIQLKAAQSNDLMLDITGYKTADQLEIITPEMRQSMKQTESNRVYYVLELSGLWVRRKRIREAYDWACTYGTRANPEIICTEFKDPLSQLGKRRRNRKTSLSKRAYMSSTCL